MAGSLIGHSHSGGVPANGSVYPFVSMGDFLKVMLEQIDWVLLQCWSKVTLEYQHYRNYNENHICLPPPIHNLALDTIKGDVTMKRSDI